MNTMPSPDLQILLNEYFAAGEMYPRWPWTWSAMTPDQAAALDTVVERWISTYNKVWAHTEAEIVPACWRQHPGLAIDTTVMTWGYYFAHHDPRATPLVAVQYHHQALVHFRSAVERWLGEEPRKCRTGQHPDSWRAGPESLIDLMSGNTKTVHNEPHMPLRELHFGFDHLAAEPEPEDK
ncbi:hypothetical protein [Kibdelosporangium phytohabitans]|uniref:DUF4913 domain-containing protein n=1 Tax=Kibdelosporangium phytohabitans TaxID=860235 RepID=A0A0N9HWW5_9PSEU|nr:hypothetical protein [Kibdelosporangium phytohabitans]ALG06368.1 hypothetical protein AOZ06_05015 [Kibdelosporangium phytohabitans]MBE1467511.1 hypothetical protein [Kibdelosporangium phytohabitans]